MPALAEIQAAFARALLQDQVEPAATMVAGDGLEPAARLQIYRHHVFTTLTATLASTYPVICRLVDERFFGYAADQYIRAHPPAGPCLFEYGGELAAFIAAFEPCRRLPYLPDVARLEWALNAAAHADDVTPLDPAILRRVPEADLARLTLRLDPSLTLLSSPWPVDRIWHANQPDVDPDVPVDLASGGVCLEVRRPAGASPSEASDLESQAVFRAIDRATHAFRRVLQQGRCLEDAAADALEVDGGFDLGRACQALFEERLLVDFAVSAASIASG
jgi:Putative DNA-binding domain